MQLHYIGISCLGLCAAAWCQPGQASVYFSEYVEGSSNNKAVEIVNTGPASVDLSSYAVSLYFNGSASAGQTISLSGTLDAGDVFVLANSSASFAASADALSGSLTFNGDDAVALSADGSILDVIGQIGSDPGSYWGSAPTKTQDATLRRLDSVSNGDTDGSDAFDPSVEWLGLAQDSFDGLGCAGEGACETQPPELTRIFDLQGAGHVSPYNGQVVVARGIVTALRTVSGPGFYLQDPDGDDDMATSDAVFVYTGGTPTVSVGDEVLVSGSVSEYRAGGSSSGNLSTTQLSAISVTAAEDAYFVNGSIAATVLGEGGRPIPTQVIDDDTDGSVEVDAQTTYDPDTDGIDFMESLEAMMVRVNAAQAVSPSNQYGEVWVVADVGAQATGINDRGGITLVEDDGVIDYNPERLQFDDVLFGSMPAVSVGDTAVSLEGVVSYDFGNFEILPSQAPEFAAGDLQREIVDVAMGADRLTIANYNVENLDPNDNDPNSNASGCPDMDIADGKFDAIAAQIVDNLASPDIVALQEVQDDSGCVDDGVTSSALTLSTLVDAIVNAGGPAYAAFDIPPVNDQDGGLPGGNIRVAYLYNAARVDLVEGTFGTGGSTDATSPVLDDQGQLSLTLSPGRVSPNDVAWASTRKPLAAVFEFNGHRIVTVNNHWSSKGGGTSLYGRYQPAVNGSQDEREAQAASVKAFVDSTLAVDPQAKVVVLGDLNEFSFLPPLEILRGSPQTLFDLMDEQLPSVERYSYNFEGNAQALDHLLVSEALLAASPEFDAVHINSEYVDQLSDHDPNSASLLLPAQVCDDETLRFSADQYLAFEDQLSVVISVLRDGVGCGAVAVDYSAVGGSADVGSDYEPVSGALVWPNGATGSRSFTVNLIDDSRREAPETLWLQLSNPSGAALGGAARVQLRIRDGDWQR